MRPLEPGEHWCAASSAATATSPAWRRTRNVATYAALRAVRRLLALGGRAVLRARRQVPDDDLHRGHGRAQGAAAGRVHRGRAGAWGTTCASGSGPRSRSPSARAPSGPARAWPAQPVELSRRRASTTQRRDGRLRAPARRRDGRRRHAVRAAGRGRGGLGDRRSLLIHGPSRSSTSRGWGPPRPIARWRDVGGWNTPQ